VPVRRSAKAQVTGQETVLAVRTGQLKESLSRLDEVWAAQVPRIGSDRGRQKAREAAALAAHARWMYRSSLARPESRGIRCREDYPDIDPSLTLRLRTGGLDQVWVRQEAPLTGETPVTQTAGQRPAQFPIKLIKIIDKSLEGGGGLRHGRRVGRIHGARR
jgi:hypothetical protein